MANYSFSNISISSSACALLAGCLTTGVIGCSDGSFESRVQGGGELATARARFDEIDRNGDGVITSEELGNQRLFRRVDANADGQITLEEARTALENRRDNATRESSPSEESAAEDLALEDSPFQISISNNTKTAVDIPYATHAGTDPSLTSLDIYTPEGVERAPVMIYVHGGGWRRGDKGNVAYKPKMFNSNGYVLVSLNYRLVSDIEFPANAQDVADGIAWVHANIQQYGGDPDQLFLMGHSAGAHLVGLVSTDEQYLAAAGESLDILKGSVLLDSAAYDIPLAMQTSGRRGRKLYENAFSENQAVWAAASPVNYVAAGKQIPPFLLVHANRRQNEENQAFQLADELALAGIRADVAEAPNETHESLNQTLGEPENVSTEAVLAFLSSLQVKGK